MNQPALRDTAADRLRSAIGARARAEIAEAEAIADFAAENEWPADAEIDLVGQRPARVGADGTPVLNEFVALEVAGLKGISVGAATWLIRDIVNLRYRHPRLWARMRAGDLAVFRACQLAAHVARFTLSRDELAQVDAELAAHAANLGWRRLLGLCDGLLAELVPDQLEERSRRARADRYVRKLPTDDPTVAYLAGRVDTADAVFFDGMLDRIADILATQGDPDSKDARRAKSLGILATPARATLLLAEAAMAQETGKQPTTAAEGPSSVEPAGRLDSSRATLARSRTGTLFDSAGRRSTRHECPQSVPLGLDGQFPDEPSGHETPEPADLANLNDTGAAHEDESVTHKFVGSRDRHSGGDSSSPPMASGPAPGEFSQPDDPLDQVWVAAREAIPTIRWTDKKLLPKSTVYLHLAEHTLMTGRGPVRAETVGPLAATMLGLLVGHTRINLRPVMRPFDDSLAVDAYEIPRRIREQVILRDQVEVFPFSSRSARNQQMDHTVPYRKGTAGQTRAGNLGPLSTKVHRGKTHGHWRLNQPRPGVFWWTSPAGNEYRVASQGAINFDPDEPLDRAFRRALRKFDEAD